MTQRLWIAGGAGLALSLLVGCPATDPEPAGVFVTASHPLGATPDWVGDPSPGTSVHYGRELCGAGDINGDGFEDVAVGAPSWFHLSGQGRVFVYFGSPSGPAEVADQLLDSSIDGEAMGRSLAGAGDVNGDGYADLIVGSSEWSGDTGRAQLFHGSATGLVTPSAWTVEWTQAEAHFGRALAGAGDVNGDGYADVLVGAPGHDNGQTDEGIALLYLGSASGLEAVESWSFEGDFEDAYVGESVDGAGDVNGDGYADVIVGGSEFNDDVWREGRAWAFYGSATGLSVTPDWFADEDGDSARFGDGVGGVGDVNGDGYADVAVGAPYWPEPYVGTGGAFVYLGSSTGLAPDAAWTALGLQVDGRFGGEVTAGGDVNGDGYADLVVTDPYDSTTATYEGRVYLYLGSASGPSATADWTHASGWLTGGYFGNGRPGSGDFNGDGLSDVLVGVHGWENFTGRAFLFLGQADPPSESAVWIVDSSELGAEFGYSIAGVGDVDGDGYDEVLVGAHEHDAVYADEGAAFLYPGSPTGALTTPAWAGQGAQAGGGYGYAVGPAGDVDGDGYDDVVVAADQYSGALTDSGAAWVHHGSSTGLDPVAGWTAEGDQAGCRFGAAAYTAGDVNADGFSDLFVGASLYDDGQEDEGRAHVFLGSPTGLEALPSWIADSDSVHAWLGWSGGTAGDVNGDGYDDLVVGAPQYGAGQLEEGAAFVYLGSVSGLAPVHGWMMESDQADGKCGISAAGAGDVDGDGFDEVIVGCYHYDDAEADEGRAFLFAGSAAGLSTSPDWEAGSGQLQANLGIGVGSAGDVNGDGYGDVVVGAYAYDDGQGNEGIVLVYPGSPAGLSGDPLWSVGSNGNSALLGRIVSSADVNGDGLSDVVSGSHEWASSGRAWIWLGGGLDTSTGPVLRPMAVQSSASAPLTPGTRSSDVAGFAVSALSRSAFGRGHVSLEVEAKPAGVPFDGSGLDASGFVDSGDPAWPAPDLVQGLTGLASDTGYHWRTRLVHDPSDAPPQRHSRWVYGGRAGRPLSRHVVTACLDDTDGDGQCDPVDLDDDDDGFEDGADCGPLEAAVYPGALEACDDLDSDCDGSVADEYPDFDGDDEPDCVDLDDDGDGDPDDTDCDDADPDFFAGAPEYCDPFDHDCDGSLVDGYPDLDADGEPDCIDPDDDGDGSDDEADCAPLDATVFPGATEACDDLDTDCDGNLVDEFEDADDDGLPDCVDEDADGDGYPSLVDCDDLDATVHPNAAEACDDLDSDCDGELVDDFDDTDGDGDPDCTDPDIDGDDSANDLDCDPLDEAVFPGATEACDDLDSDCDGELVDDFDDGDGDGDPDCTDPDDDGDGVLDEADCAPQDGAISPSTPEVCDDALDNDCDGDVDFDDEADCLPVGCACDSAAAGGAGWLPALGLLLLFGLRWRPSPRVCSPGVHSTPLGPPRRRFCTPGVHSTPLALLALLLPTLAQAGPANDAAMAAWDAHQQHCAATVGQDVAMTAGSMELVLPVWQEVDRVYRSTGEGYLLYWRAVLALCVQQGDLAGQDLQDFLCAEGANPMFTELAADAEARLRRMGMDDRCAEKNVRRRSEARRAEARAARLRAAQQRPIVSVGLGGGYQFVRDWSYGAVAADVSVRLVGPLRITGGVRPAIGARLRSADGEHFDPARHLVLTTITVGALVQARGPVEPFVGALFQLSPNPVGALGPPVLVGPALLAGVEIPLLPSPIALRPVVEVGLSDRFFSLRGLVQVVVRVPDRRSSG